MSSSVHGGERATPSQVANLRRRIHVTPEAIPQLANELFRSAADNLSDGSPRQAARLAQEAAVLCEIINNRQKVGADSNPESTESTGRSQEDLATKRARQLEQSAADARALIGHHGVYQLNLAETLVELTGYYDDQGKEDKAAATVAEAVEIYRILAEKDQSYLQQLAEALGQQADILRHGGEPELAIDPAQDSLALYQELARLFKGRSPNEEIEALARLGAAYSDAAKHEEALVTSEDVVALRLEQVERGEVASTLLANALMDVAERQIAADNPKEALAPLEDAAEIYRLYADDDRTAARKLAIALLGIGKTQEMLGSPFRALDPVEHASRLLRTWVAESTTFRHLFRRSLLQLADLYDTLGYSTEAAAVREEVKLIRQSRRA